jgi:hypothetical protein
MRAYLTALFAIVLSGSALAGDGIDMPGRDYASFDAPTWSSCRDTCAGESDCWAYTWVKPGFQGPNGRCYLKSSIPQAVKNPCCVSASHVRIPERDVKAEGKINRPGSDYKNFNTNDWQECEATCGVEDACKSWTYVHPGIQGKTGRCWLKNKVARPVPDLNTDSGVKFRPPSSTL